jgi:hypothetical protein
VIEVDEKQQVLAAAQIAGSLVGAILNRAAGFLEIVSEVFVCAVFSTFVGPAFNEWQGVNSLNYQACFDFLCGVFGFLIMFSIFTWIKNSRIVETLVGKYLQKLP